MWKSGEDLDARPQLLRLDSDGLQFFTPKLGSDGLQLLTLNSDGLQLITSTFTSSPLTIRVLFWPSLLSHSSIGLILVVVSFYANHNAVDNWAHFRGRNHKAMKLRKMGLSFRTMHDISQTLIYWKTPRKIIFRISKESSRLIENVFFFHARLRTE